MREGWELKKLGEVCEKITRGISPRYIDQNGTIVVNQKCVRDHKINFDLARLHDENTKSISVDKFLRVGDVLVNSTGEGTLGRVAQVRDLPEEKVTVDSHVSIVRPIGNQFYLDFFGWAMIYIESEIEESGAGASGQTELARTVLENNFSIAYPKSLPEQQRIVALLDEAFAAIAKAKANAEQNLKNAKELFESYLHGVFEKKGEGWEIKTLREVCKVIAGQSPEGKYYNKEGMGLPFYQGKKEYGVKFLREPTTWTTKVTKEAEEGDILMSVRAPVGPVNIATQKICIGRGLAAIRAGMNINQEFLYNFLLKHESEIEGNSGAVFNSINKSQISDIKIPLPTLTEQQTIVRQLDSLREETQKLEAVYQQKLSDLEELKKSILQKAFAGELTGASN